MAKAYRWSESEILGLSTQDRLAYIDLVQQAAEAERKHYEDAKKNR